MCSSEHKKKLLAMIIIYFSSYLQTYCTSWYQAFYTHWKTCVVVVVVVVVVVYQQLKMTTTNIGRQVFVVVFSCWTTKKDNKQTLEDIIDFCCVFKGCPYCPYYNYWHRAFWKMLKEKGLVLHYKHPLLKT